MKERLYLHICFREHRETYTMGTVKQNDRGLPIKGQCFMNFDRALEKPEGNPRRT